MLQIFILVLLPNYVALNTLFIKPDLLTLKTLIYEGTNELKPLVTEFVT
jgi:hypothetical protein